MDGKVLKVGLVGTGWVSGEHIRAWQNNPNGQIAGISSRTIEGAKAKAEEFGLTCPCFAGMERMLDEVDLDIIDICTPNHLHCEQTVLAAERHKHVVMEKPIALSSEELKAVVKAVKKAGIKTITSFVLRWNPLFCLLRNLLDDDSIGEVFYGEVDYYHGIGPWYKQFAWNKKKAIGGSSLLSAGCHALDGLLWFMGEEVVEVTAYSTKGKGELFKPYEYDPTQVTLLKFKSGKIGKVASSIDCRIPYFFNILLLGSKGSIRNNELWSHKLQGQTRWATIPTILPDSGDVTHHPFQGEIDHFVSCIQQDKEPMTGIDFSARLHEIIFAADRSAKERRPVKV